MKTRIEREYWQEQKVERVIAETKSIRFLLFLLDLVCFFVSMYFFIGALVMGGALAKRLILGMLGIGGAFFFGNHLRIRLYVYLQ